MKSILLYQAAIQDFYSKENDEDCDMEWVYDNLLAHFGSTDHPWIIQSDDLDRTLSEITHCPMDYMARRFVNSGLAQFIDQ